MVATNEPSSEEEGDATAGHEEEEHQPLPDVRPGVGAPRSGGKKRRRSASSSSAEGESRRREGPDDEEAEEESLSDPSRPADSGTSPALPPTTSGPGPRGELRDSKAAASSLPHSTDAASAITQTGDPATAATAMNNISGTRNSRAAEKNDSPPSALASSSSNPGAAAGAEAAAEATSRAHAPSESVEAAASAGTAASGTSTVMIGTTGSPNPHPPQATLPAPQPASAAASSMPLQLPPNLVAGTSQVPQLPAHLQLPSGSAAHALSRPPPPPPPQPPPQPSVLQPQHQSPPQLQPQNPSVVVVQGVESAAVEQMTRNVLSLLSLYGPLTLGQMEYNLPPLSAATATPASAAPFLQSATAAAPPQPPSGPSTLAPGFAGPGPATEGARGLPTGIATAPSTTAVAAAAAAASASAAAAMNLASSFALSDVLQILVAVGLVQTVGVNSSASSNANNSVAAATAAAAAAATTTGSGPPSGTAPAATTRYCVNRGIPRADVVLPTHILDEIEAAHTEARRSWERRNLLASLLAPTATATGTTASASTTTGTSTSAQPPTSVAPATTTTPTTHSASTPAPQPPIVEPPHRTPPPEADTTPLKPPRLRALLQRLVDDYPEVLHDPVYVTGLRNLHVDATDSAAAAGGAGGAGSGTGKGKKKRKLGDGASGKGGSGPPSKKAKTVAPQQGLALSEQPQLPPTSSVGVSPAAMARPTAATIAVASPLVSGSSTSPSVSVVANPLTGIASRSAPSASPAAVASTAAAAASSTASITAAGAETHTNTATTTGASK